MKVNRYQMHVARFRSVLIRKVSLLSAWGLTLLSAEGRRKVAWRHLNDSLPAAGWRLTAVEYRWVVWRLFGVIPVLATWPQWVELPVTRGLGSERVPAVEYYSWFDDAFRHPLCRFNAVQASRRAADRHALEPDHNVLQA